MKEFWHSLTADKMIALTVLVAALGYFVDGYDLVLFSVLRVASLRDLGIAPEAMLDTGAYLLSMQLGGFLVGGLIWGVMGDRIGRKQVLFGSILLYSLANIANAFVTDIGGYAVCRLLSGIGLAGEIGAGITLVSELMPKKYRGYGTTVVASVGVLGGAVAGFVGHMLHWQAAYIVGGVMGLALLGLRVAVSESGMFKTVKEQAGVRRGDLRMLLRPDRFVRFVACILIAVPIWYAVAVLITFAPEIGRAMHATGDIKAATALPFCYLGLTLGDFASGILSQRLQSRKKSLALFMVFSALAVAVLLLQKGIAPEIYYAFSFAIGVSMGYWVLMLTTSAEQFGTNLRATVATGVPNFVRGAGVAITASFAALKVYGVIASAAIVGAGCFALAFAALFVLRETFHTDLNFIEDEREYQPTI